MLVLKIKKRYFLKKKKVKEIKNELGDYGSFINNKDTLEMLEAEDYDFILVNGEPYIIIINGKPYPTLKAALNLELDSKVVVVDMGAVRFVTKGADVMSPGIVDADESIVPDVGVRVAVHNAIIYYNTYQMQIPYQVYWFRADHYHNNIGIPYICYDNTYFSIDENAVVD